MILKSKKAAEVSRAFEFKGRMLTLTVLNILEEDLVAIDQQLGEKIAQAPEFFRNSPIVIDANGFADIELQKVADIIRSHEMVPVGLIGGDAKHEQTASEIGLGVFPKIKAVAGANQEDSKKKDNKQHDENKAENSAEKESEEVENTEQGQVAKTEELVPEPQISKSPTMLIKQPVRSGQQIYAKGSDLVIMSSVGAGAEVLADGHIHIYGSLRGRALAGVQGDSEARIFCNNLDAELISIAGQYKMSEDIPAEVKKGFVQVYLEDELMKIKQV